MLEKEKLVLSIAKSSIEFEKSSFEAEVARVNRLLVEERKKGRD